MSNNIEPQPVNEANWDYLIVLDACRYDYFKENYQEFLKGDLKKVESRGSATPEWLWNTFNSRYQYNYISANPYINNQGLTLGELVSGHEQKTWKATDHFQNIVDSWIQDWDKELNTVKPEKLTDTALENLEYSKTIIHYIQPHRPFISLGETSFEWAPKDRLEGKEDTQLRKLIDTTRPIWHPIRQKAPKTIENQIKQKLGLGNQYQKLAKKHGEKQTQQYYQQDLKLALKQVKRLVKQLDGKIIVTSDHGELLGEQNQWGHSIGQKNPELLQVPWLEVERVKN